LKQTEQARKITKVAASLFAKKGYNGVGVAEIGAASGFGRGTLYHHIESKEDLLHEIASQYISGLVESGHKITNEYPDPIVRLNALSRHLMDVISKSLSEIVVCFREVQSLTGSRHEDVMCMHAEYQKIWSQTIEEGVQKNVFREVDKIAVKGLLGMYFYSCLWLKPDGLQSPEDIADVFSDLVVRSLSKTTTE
jgi:AcrR family transcriptional regulator